MGVSQHSFGSPYSTHKCLNIFFLSWEELTRCGEATIHSSSQDGVWNDTIWQCFLVLLLGFGTKYMPIIHFWPTVWTSNVASKSLATFISSGHHSGVKAGFVSWSQKQPPSGLCHFWTVYQRAQQSRGGSRWENVDKIPFDDIICLISEFIQDSESLMPVLWESWEEH